MPVPGQAGRPRSSRGIEGVCFGRDCRGLLRASLKEFAAGIIEGVCFGLLPFANSAAPGVNPGLPLGAGSLAQEGSARKRRPGRPAPGCGRVTFPLLRGRAERLRRGNFRLAQPGIASSPQGFLAMTKPGAVAHGGFCRVRIAHHGLLPNSLKGGPGRPLSAIRRAMRRKMPLCLYSASSSAATWIKRTRSVMR